MAEEPVTIVDRDVLKVLSNDTRMDILKMLSEGGRNPSFVAKKLKKSDATIVEHLQTLTKVGLVKKTTSPGKKWVFYSLTERGEGIIKSKSRKLVIILGTSILAMVGGAASFTKHLYTSGTFAAQSLEGVRDSAAPAAAEIATQTTAQIAQLPFFQIGVVLFVTGIAGLGFYFYKKPKMDKIKI